MMVNHGKIMLDSLTKEVNLSFLMVILKHFFLAEVVFASGQECFLSERRRGAPVFCSFPDWKDGMKHPTF